MHSFDRAAEAKRRLKRGLSLILLYIVAGYIIEISSLPLHVLPVITDLWAPLYPLYLICRTQSFMLYLVLATTPYTMGMLTLSVMWFHTLATMSRAAGPTIVYPVLYEYIGDQVRK